MRYEIRKPKSDDALIHTGDIIIIETIPYIVFETNNTIEKRFNVVSLSDGTVLFCKDHKGFATLSQLTEEIKNFRHEIIRKEKVFLIIDINE